MPKISNKPKSLLNISRGIEVNKTLSGKKSFSSLLLIIRIEEKNNWSDPSGLFHPQKNNGYIQPSFLPSIILIPTLKNCDILLLMLNTPVGITYKRINIY